MSGWGVFATRSPFRPNPLYLSCGKLERVELSTPKGPVLHVSGANLMDGTPIYDIKPYVPCADCRPEAREGFATLPDGRLRVEIPSVVEKRIPPDQREALRGCSPGIPGLTISMTLPGFAGWSLLGWRSSSPWRELDFGGVSGLPIT